MWNEFSTVLQYAIIERLIEKYKITQMFEYGQKSFDRLKDIEPAGARNVTVRIIESWSGLEAE